MVGFVGFGLSVQKGVRRLTVGMKMEVDPAIVEYVAPEFTKGLPVSAPSWRARLAMQWTPIQKFRLPGLPEEFEVFVKRDDMTGSTLSGNKIRKLEFILADAVEKKADTIITCGGVQSNFCRCAVMAAKELGMDSHVFLRSATPGEVQSVGSLGNMFLHKLNGTVVHLIEKQPYLVGILPKMKQLAEQLIASGKTPYLIPVGGSDEIGLWGYLEGWQEMISQGVLESVSDVVVSVGSGGTAAGLAIGNYLSGSKVKVHAVSVCDNAAYFHGHINEMLKALGLEEQVSSEEIINIIDGYKGRGYALNTSEELFLFKEIARTSGVPVDPVYTGKGVRGMLMEMILQAESGEGPFQGRKVLFVHTGGIFGLYDGQIVPFLNDTDVSTWHGEAS